MSTSLLELWTGSFTQLDKYYTLYYQRSNTTCWVFTSKEHVVFWYGNLAHLGTKVQHDVHMCSPLTGKTYAYVCFRDLIPLGRHLWTPYHKRLTHQFCGCWKSSQNYCKAPQHFRKLKLGPTPWMQNGIVSAIRYLQSQQKVRMVTQHCGHENSVCLFPQSASCCCGTHAVSRHCMLSATTVVRWFIQTMANMPGVAIYAQMELCMVLSWRKVVEDSHTWRTGP